MRVWIDDLRAPPDDTWVWVKTSSEALSTLTQTPCTAVIELSFDHDLGGSDTSRPIVLWMCENEWWPSRVYVHSANPVGSDWLMGMCRRYAPAATVVRRIDTPVTAR